MHPNATLLQQLNVLTNLVKQKGITSEQVAAYLDELIDLASKAIEKRDFYFLGSCTDVTRRLNSACFGLIPTQQDLAQRFVQHFKLEADILISFLTSDYLTLPPEIGEPMLSDMVENIIRHGAYYEPDRPHIAARLLEAVLGQSRAHEPAIALFKAIVLSNATDWSGAGLSIYTLEDAKVENSDEIKCLDEIVRMMGQSGSEAEQYRESIEKLRASFVKVNNASEGVIAWAKDNQESIAASIKAGSITEWINESAVKAAQSLELPLVAGALAIRSNDFNFAIMARLYEENGVISDDRHLEKVMKHPANDADVIAFSLAHQDILYDIDPSQDVVMLVGEALEKLGDKSLNLLCIYTVLEKLVSKLKPSDDVTDMADSRLGQHLKRHRKFNGLLLGNQMGL